MNIKAKQETILLSYFRRMDDNKQEYALDLLRMLKDGYLDGHLDALREVGAADSQERELLTLYRSFDEQCKFLTIDHARLLVKCSQQQAAETLEDAP